MEYDFRSVIRLPFSLCSTSSMKVRMSIRPRHANADQLIELDLHRTFSAILRVLEYEN